MPLTMSATGWRVKGMSEEPPTSARSQPGSSGSARTVSELQLSRRHNSQQSKRHSRKQVYPSKLVLPRT